MESVSGNLAVDQTFDQATNSNAGKTLKVVLLQRNVETVSNDALAHEPAQLRVERDKTGASLRRDPIIDIRRTFDVVVSLSALILLAPVMLLVALAVKLSSPGPIFLRQSRLTLGGREFELYKFRSMYVDAETRTGAVWATANDPRVTKVGRFIRLTRLDELPQLINVLKGDMSIIGPRPERPEFAAVLRSRYRRFDKRLHVKAGITGLAQVCGGYSGCMESYRRKIAFDVVYIQKRSLWMDLQILCRTVFVVISGSGAR